MIPINNTLTQKIVNKCNLMNDFTFNLKSKPIDNYNYIVSIKNICTTKNPSLVLDLNLKIKDILEERTVMGSLYFDSVGLWHDADTNLYCIDANLHFYNLDSAIDSAKLTNQKAIFDIQNNKCITIKY